MRRRIASLVVSVLALAVCLAATGCGATASAYEPRLSTAEQPSVSSAPTATLPATFVTASARVKAPEPVVASRSYSGGGPTSQSGEMSDAERAAAAARRRAFNEAQGVTVIR